MFSHVVCGGTFDTFHEGHKQLIRKCFKVGQKVTIGITSQKMALQKLKRECHDSWVTRRKNVSTYAQVFNRQFTIVRINDIYGPTILERSIDAIVITQDTEKGANLINKKRVELGMKPLSVVFIDLKKGNDNVVISSTRIRQGYINRHGTSYRSLLFSRKVHHLPKSLIPALRMPLGHSFRTIEEYLFTKTASLHNLATTLGDTMWITVGDVVTHEFVKRGFSPTFSVIDKKTLRKALNKEYLEKIIQKDCLYALNEKGTISQDSIKALFKLISLEHKRAIKQLIIDGEEDLLVLPVVLISPLGTRVMYGMRDRGIVAIEVTEKVKEKVYNLLKLFE